MLILGPRQQALYQKLHTELEQIHQNTQRVMDTQPEWNDEIRTQKIQALHDYIGKLSDHECSDALFKQQDTPWTNLRRSLLKMIYPVGFWQTSMQPPWVRHEIADNLHSYEHSGWLHSIQIFTQDHVMLDGLLIRQPHMPNNAPILLIAPGNGQTMEELCRDAQQYAQQYKIQVLLFNGRGINKSMGRMHSTQDAVHDCEAALLLAAQLSDKIAIHGISLGGGIMAAALARLHKTQKLNNNQVTLACFQHTFASLPKAASALLVNSNTTRLSRVKVVVVAWFIDCFLGLLGYHKLNTTQILAQTHIAQEVLVTYAKDDPIIRYGARLQDFLRLKKTLANKVFYIENTTNNHMAYHLTNQHRLFDEAMRRLD